MEISERRTCRKALKMFDENYIYFNNFTKESKKNKDNWNEIT